MTQIRHRWAITAS